VIGIKNKNRFFVLCLCFLFIVMLCVVPVKGAIPSGSVNVSGYVKALNVSDIGVGDDKESSKLNNKLVALILILI